jgi:ABC-type glycerol-3-phosphate transport system permease component
MISPVIFFNLIMAIIGVFRVFEMPYIMTNGGPARATQVIAMYVYENSFLYVRMGYASAMALIQLLIVLALTGIAFWSSRRWVALPGEVILSRARARTPMASDQVIPYARPVAATPRTADSVHACGARRRRVAQFLMTHLALALICAGFILPLAWMISTSLKTNKESMLFPPTLVPNQPNWKSYPDVLNHPRVDFPLFARNTVVVAGLAVVGTTFVSAFVAYGFSKVKFRGRGVLFAMMLSTMMIPFPVIMSRNSCSFRWLDVHTPFQFPRDI